MMIFPLAELALAFPQFGCIDCQGPPAVWPLLGLVSGLLPLRPPLQVVVYVSLANTGDVL